MSKLAEEMGIPEKDLKEALILVRNLRITAISKGLDPRATRVAIIVLNLMDSYFAKKVLNKIELATLDQIAHQLFHEAKK